MTISKNKTKQSSYTAEDIEVLEGLEPVRKRPGMFIAGTDTPSGLHQLVDEILDNSIDEAMNGFADKIVVILHQDQQSVTITDNGRGIPVDMHPKFKKPTLEIILTTLHAGGKFSGKNYQTSGGLHGVGSSVVNALSEELVATITREGKTYQQNFSRGKPTSSLKTIKTDAKKTASCGSSHGTSIFFRPDSEIFNQRKFSISYIRNTVQTKTYLNPGLKITLIDEASKIQEEFCYLDGLKSYLAQLIQDQKETVVGENFLINKEDGISISIALAWTENPKEEFLSFANGIYTHDGGSHEIGVKSGIVRAIRNYMNVHKVQTKGLKITADDIREGLICLVSVKIPSALYQAQFQGQTKSKLNNPEITPLVENALRILEQQLNQKPSIAQAIMGRVLLAAKARTASREAVQSIRRKVGVSHRLNLPGKLADCSGNKQELTELFIVEGDSAGGSAKQGRDRNIQAVLPLRGKVLNTITSNGKKIVENKEFSNIISALGCGFDNDVRLEKLRYGKIIILTDADSDGMHIGTLLMAFFFKHIRALIEAGHLYLGNPPLYGIFPKGSSLETSSASFKSQKAKAKKTGVATKTKARVSNVYWAYSDEELEVILKKHKLSNPRIVRYKGLGEMNPETLWETTLDPENRTLLRVTISDAQLANQELEALMGSDTQRRYEMIQASADVVEIDV
ncbi:MAG: type IIA DNA topoisomerase subunit B [Deltaproteobacteria bacterium]|jgi:DNA gyrase subunit B/topoisomerase-4 subunit B|nr:type IIA DNA topoisomerase subunit B [Deltaproteobacteria bacterium]